VLPQHLTPGRGQWLAVQGVQAQTHQQAPLHPPHHAQSQRRASAQAPAEQRAPASEGGAEGCERSTHPLRAQTLEGRLQGAQALRLLGPPVPQEQMPVQTHRWQGVQALVSAVLKLLVLPEETASQEQGVQLVLLLLLLAEEEAQELVPQDVPWALPPLALREILPLQQRLTPTMMLQVQTQAQHPQSIPALVKVLPPLKQVRVMVSPLERLAQTPALPEQ
jgi:hypothetical protein